MPVLSEADYVSEVRHAAACIKNATPFGRVVSIRTPRGPITLTVFQRVAMVPVNDHTLGLVKVNDVHGAETAYRMFGGSRMSLEMIRHAFADEARAVIDSPHAEAEARGLHHQHTDAE